MTKTKGWFNFFWYKKYFPGVCLIPALLFATHCVFATTHIINIMNNSTEKVTLSDFWGRCVFFNNELKIDIKPGESYAYTWEAKKFEGAAHIACANSSKKEHTTSWVAFKMSTIRKGSSYAEYLGMTQRSENCGGFTCDAYNIGLFYAAAIGGAPSDGDFNPLPYTRHPPIIPEWVDGAVPEGIQATCDYMDVSKNCMDSFSKMVAYNDSFKFPFGLDHPDHKWTFTIFSPPNDVKIINPTENAHFLAENGKGVDISGTAEPGSIVEFGYNDKAQNHTAAVGADSKWKGSIPYLDMLSQVSYGDITHSTIYARYFTQFTYATQTDQKNILIAEPVKVTVNGLDADNAMPVKSWTVQGMKSTTGNVSGEVCEEEGHKNCVSLPLSADNSMYWATSSPIPTASGNYIFSITQKLQGFDNSTASFIATKLTPLSVSEPQAESDHSAPYLLTPAGTGTSGAEIQYTIDEQSFQKVRVVNDHWTGVQVSLTPGSHTLAVTETRDGGKQENVTTHFTVDAPVAITSPVTNQWVLPGSSLTVAGKAEPSAKISCVMDDNDWFGSSAVASTSGTFNCKLTVPGDSGKHTVAVTESVNNLVRGKDTRDIVAADSLTIKKTDQKNDVVTIKGTKDKKSSLGYMLDDKPFTYTSTFEKQTDWAVELPGLTYGRHKFEVYQVIDGLRSVSEQDVFTVLVPVSITSPVEGGSVIAYTRFAVRGEGEPGDRVQVEVNNIDKPWVTFVDGAGQWMIYGPWSGEGLYQYTATESEDGKTINTVCRNVQVLGLNPPAQNESVDLCSENPETQGRKVK